MGVGGSSLATVSNVLIGQPLVFIFNQTPNPSAPVAVNQVEIVSSQNLGIMELIALPVNLGDALQGRIVAGYLKINPIGINPNTLGPGRIWFSVNDQWIRDHNVNPADIVLMRNHENRWSELPTTFDHQAGNAYYFDATTPGLSYFAIVAKLPGLPSNSTAILPANPVVQTSSQISTTKPAVQPYYQNPVTTMKTSTIIPSVDSPQSGSPINWAIAGLIGSIVLIGIMYLIRRWWIRRQNPALFREYD